MTTRTGIILTILLLAATLATAQESKLTERARRQMAADNPYFPQLYWIFLDSSALAEEPIALSERARSRRAKVDPGGLLVDGRDYPIRAEVVDSLAAAGVVPRRASRYLRAVSALAEAGALAAASRLEFVERIDVVRRLARVLPPQAKFDTPPVRAAEDYGYGFSLRQNEMIESVPLHRAGFTGAGVRIAILDTGYDLLHPAFASTSVIAAYDFINLDGTVDEYICPLDPDYTARRQNEHGTFVLGILGANLADTLVGIAPDAEYLLAKTEIVCYGTEVKLEEDNWIAAAEWADSAGADIIATSLGYHTFQDSGSYSPEDLDGNTALITRAADIAASKNILVVASAGNDGNSGWGRIGFPADGDSVLAVGAVGPDSILTGFSSPGPSADGRIKPDVVALGAAVFSAEAEPERGYGYSQGTSYSAPTVAGTAALVMQYHPDLAAAEVFARLREGADRSSQPDNRYGYGLVSTIRAVGLPQIVPLPEIEVYVAETLTVDVVTSGISDPPPAILGLGLPGGVSLADRGDGSAVLTVIGQPSVPFRAEFAVVADAHGAFGRFADTVGVSLITIARGENAVFAGPNPFRESVRFFPGPQGPAIEAVSIFNAAGEKIWEEVNIGGLSSDVVSNRGVVIWDGRNGSGRPVAAGVYLARVRAGSHTATLKLLKID